MGRQFFHNGRSVSLDTNAKVQSIAVSLIFPWLTVNQQAWYGDKLIFSGTILASTANKS